MFENFKESIFENLSSYVFDLLHMLDAYCTERYHFIYKRSRGRHFYAPSSATLNHDPTNPALPLERLFRPL